MLNELFTSQNATKQDWRPFSNSFLLDFKISWNQIQHQATMKPFTTPYLFLIERLRGRGATSAWIEYLITITCGIGWVWPPFQMRYHVHMQYTWEMYSDPRILILVYNRNMLFGYDQGVMGSLLTGPSFEATFPSISNGHNTTLQGFTVNSILRITLASQGHLTDFSGRCIRVRMCCWCPDRHNQWW